MKNQLNLFWNTEKQVLTVQNTQTHIVPVKATIKQVELPEKQVLHVKNPVLPVIRKMKNQLNLFWNPEKHVCTCQKQVFPVIEK